MRELNSLCCSINYSKAREQEERLCLEKSGKEMSGNLSVPDEDSFMECSGSGGCSA